MTDFTHPTPKALTEADLAGLPRAVSHTPGKLIVRGGFSLYAEDRKTPVADACLNASIAAHDECNARRLAACWNALEGVPTEEIETVLIHGKALKDVVSERDALAGRVAELEAEREILAYERNHARAHYNNSVALLTGIHSLMYPAPFTTPEGKTMVFRPQSINPHELLQELSDRIRALPDKLAALSATTPESKS